MQREELSVSSSAVALACDQFGGHHYNCSNDIVEHDVIKRSFSGQCNERLLLPGIV